MSEHMLLIINTDKQLTSTSPSEKSFFYTSLFAEYLEYTLHLHYFCFP